jgi:hypothetical protein
MRKIIALPAFWLVFVVTAQAQFAGYVNHGLVGVGRVPAMAFDGLGPGVDTMGSIFSAMAFAPETWSRTGDDMVGFSHHGTLYGMPDRGYRGGRFGFKPRFHAFQISLTPYYGHAATNQTQISLALSTTTLFDDGTGPPWTGHPGDDPAATDFPRSSEAGLGLGRRSMDPSDLTRTRDGGFFVSDEYGPFIYRFDSNGVLRATFMPPDAWIPKRGPAYGSRTNDFSMSQEPDSGRANNDGFEGIALSPDGTRLFAMLQSPLVQDGGLDDGARNTRLLVFDADPGSSSYGEPVAAYVHQLTLNGNGSGTRRTVACGILAINNHQLLVMERDQRGADSGTTQPILYKTVVLVDLSGATNILHTGYSLEAGAPGQVSLPLDKLPADARPVRRQDFVNLLEPDGLARFGLNVNMQAPDSNTLPIKWEGLALMPLHDPGAPNDCLLLVGCDNDFAAPVVYQDGMAVGVNETVVDNLILAFRVTLPGGPFSVHQPYPLSQGPYRFHEWQPDERSGTYPPHIVFQQITNSPDPDLAAEMDSLWTLPYDLASRSRINGLGEEGFAFLNTANAQEADGAGYLGAAVLALDTRDVERFRVTWTGGTVLPNSRVYGIRLQYRIGEEGPFTDVLDAQGNPVEYIRNPLAGHAVSIGPVTLPAATGEQPVVHLRWKYYHISGVSGSRAQLRVGDIRVSAAEPPPRLTAALSDDQGTLQLRFRSEDGCSYQLQYNYDVRDPEWNPLGPPVNGNGGTVALTAEFYGDPQRFYRLSVSP